MTKLFLFIWSLLFTVATPAAIYPTLWDSADPLLQQALEKLVEKQHWTSAVRSGELFITVVDISDLSKPRMASLNGDKMVYAASMPKIAILLGAFVLIERGELEKDAALEDDMHLMIRNSNNAAATRVLDRVGRERLLEILQDERYKLYDKEHNGGLWVGKPYARGGAYHRDPLSNISHGATTMQVARFYYLLETGGLVNPALSRNMKEILSDPAIKHKFVKGLIDVKDIEIYRKSGTWKHYHADSALVEYGDKHKYILVGIVIKKNGGQVLEKLARSIHDMIENYQGSEK